MNEFKFTIIIPTKNRADTLYWALKTCVEQKYENLDIIVSDNSSDDNTKEVTLSFNDRRIQYINTGSPLSMTGNWEYALSHIKEGYVTFLGDDDAFLPGAISMVNKIANEKACDAINAAAIEYAWPNHVKPLHRNKMFFREYKIDEYPAVDKLLAKVIKGETSYATLPWLYKGFVSMSLIEKIKKTTKIFFYSVNPDIYSAIAISTVVDEHKYYFSKIPFAINGASYHSNGVSQGAKIKNAGAKEFLSATNLPFHNKLVLCNSIPLYVYECYLQAKDVGLIQGEELISIKDVLEIALATAKYDDTGLYQKIKSAVEKIAEKNNVEKNEIASLVKKFPNKNVLSRVIKKAKNRYFSNITQMDLDEYKVQNVYDAAIIAEKMLRKEIPSSPPGPIQAIAEDVKTIMKKFS